MVKGLRLAAAVVAVAVMSAGCVTLQEQYAGRVEKASDRTLYTAFYPSPFGEKSGYDVAVYDDMVRITKRFATVDLMGEAEQRYLAETSGSDPVLQSYLDVVGKRGGTVNAYKGILNQQLFSIPGVTDFWGQARKMSKEDAAYLEFDSAGKLRSALIRRGAFTNGSLGIGVHAESLVLSGGLVRSIENRISNRDLDNAFLRKVR